jgi:hypothetical protein
MSVVNAINQHETPVAGSTGDVNAPAGNTAAVITYAAAGAGKVNCLGGVYWSYNATPTNGNLQIADGANVIVNIDITAAGAGFLPFTPPKKGSVNTALTITLAAGGAGVSGKINATQWVEGPGP